MRAPFEARDFTAADIRRSASDAAQVIDCSQFTPPQTLFH
jgi:hypothetical protein